MKPPAPRPSSGAPRPAGPAQKPAWNDSPGWKSVKSVLEVFGILGGVISVCMVAFQLWDAEQTKRVERSLKLVERFNDEHLSKATETLRRATLDMNEQLVVMGEGAGFNKQMAETVAIGLTSSDNEVSRVNQAALIQVARFFDETALCLTSGLCDRRIVCLYLTPYAREVDEAFRPGLTVINRRSGSTTPVGTDSTPADPATADGKPPGSSVGEGLTTISGLTPCGG